MCYDEKTNTVIVYCDSFRENVVKPAEERRKIKNTVERLMKKEEVTSKEYLNLFSTISDNISNISLNKKEKEQLDKIVPKLIRNGKIKISLRDITDINKDRLIDIVQLGRELLLKKIGVEKKLGITRKQVYEEYAWQKYFELYGTYLLFGSIEQKIPESVLKINSDLRKKDSRLDIMTINRYGFIDLVELKKSDEYLFKTDLEHDNIVPTDKLNKAISQVNNYLMVLPYAKEHGKLIKGAESASGMLVFGSTKTLIRKENLNKYMKKNGYDLETAKIKVRKALRDLNYSYSHIHIVLYDELLENLDNFINQMDIEMNI